MALGAGRKGLASELVDEFGHLIGEMPTGEYYTKSQTDNKFETKTHANSTYQKKTLELPLETLMGSKLTVEDSLDALNEIQKTRQPKTLEVPIEMLSGSKLTVESALQGLNEEKADAQNTFSKDEVLNMFNILNLRKTYGSDVSMPINIDQIHNPNGYIVRFSTGAGFTGTTPSELGGNAFLLVGMSQYNSEVGLQFGVQLCIGMYSSKIAVRHANYNASGTTWSEWSYFAS